MHGLKAVSVSSANHTSHKDFRAGMLFAQLNKTGEKAMATNPIGKGTKTIGINMKRTMATDLERRSNSMHISKSKYCKIILQQWIDSGKKMTLSEEG
jgi:hypothetical protein